MPESNEDSAIVGHDENPTESLGAMRESSTADGDRPSEPDRVHPTRMSRILGGDLLRYLPSQAIPAVISLTAIPIITRLFAPDEYGDYRLVLAIAAAFAAVAWVDFAIFRFYPESSARGDLGQLRSTSVRLWVVTQFVLTIIWAAALAVVWSGLRPQLRYLLVVGLVLTNITGAFGLVSSVARSQRQIGWFSASVVFQKAVGLFGGVLLVLSLGIGIEGILYASAGASLVTVAVLGSRVARELPPPEGGMSRSLAGEMARFAFPLVIARSAIWILALGDRFMIAWLGTPTDVGLYSAAYGIAEQSVAVILILFQLPFVVLSNQIWERDGSEAAARFVRSGARAYLLVAVPAAFGISVLSTTVMQVMTSPEYHVASPIMSWISFALVLSGIQYWFSTGATFHKKTLVFVAAIVAGAILNVSLNLLLIPRFGYIAAAWTTLASYALSLLVMVGVTRRFFRWRFPLVSLARAVAASVPMSMTVLFYISNVDLNPLVTLVTAVVLGVLVYGLILAGLGELPELRRRLWKSSGSDA